MRIITVAAMAALSLGAETITVYVRDDAGVGASELCRTQSKAAEVFASAQVRVDWQKGQPKPLVLEDQRAIVVRIISGLSTSEHAGPEHARALAFAQAYEGVHVTILYERVRTLTHDRPEVILAYVLVHEITHMLQGISRHSEKGIMKARWNQADRYAMWHGRLPLAAEDVELIHLGLASRAPRTLMTGYQSPAAR
jgi:hypothetical protein